MCVCRLGGGRLAADRQLFQSELPHRLQHPEAGLVIRTDVAHQQALIDEGADEVETEGESLRSGGVSRCAASGGAGRCAPSGGGVRCADSGVKGQEDDADSRRAPSPPEPKATPPERSDTP